MPLCVSPKTAFLGISPLLPSCIEKDSIAGPGARNPLAPSWDSQGQKWSQLLGRLLGSTSASQEPEGRDRPSLSPRHSRGG